jgi:hypothetical protein
VHTHGCTAGATGSGGGIAGRGTIANSTIANNTATGGAGATFGCSPFPPSPGGNGTGGAVEAIGAITIVNTTIAGNAAKGGSGNPPGTGLGGGIHVSNPVSVINTILAGDSATTGPDCDGTVSSGGHNLTADTTACSGFNGPGDLKNVDPMLGPLQNNGGPTKTMSLPAGSPAVDAGDDSVCAAPPVNGVDQRGVPRPQGPHCEIGAYEKL